jgi:hypothetical protein
LENSDFYGLQPQNQVKNGVNNSIKLPPTPGGGPPPKISDRRLKFDNQRIVSESPGNSSADTSRLAAAAGWSPMAGAKETNMASPKEADTKMKSIFDSCSVDQLTGLKDMAKTGLRNIVADHSEDNFYQYFLPRKILNDLETNVAKNLKTKKAEAMKSAENAFAMAIADMTQHVLNFICPGQILILSMLDEVRNENKQLKQRLKNLENTKNQAVTKDDLKELMSVLNGVRAELSEVRTVAYQLKSNAIQDSIEPNNAGPRNQRASRAKKNGPSQPLGPKGRHIPGLPYQDREPSSQRNPTVNKPEQAGGGEIFVGEGNEEKSVNQEKFTYVGYKASRKGNQRPKVQEEKKRSKLHPGRSSSTGLKHQ